MRPPVLLKRSYPTKYEGKILEPHPTFWWGIMVLVVEGVGGPLVRLLMRVVASLSRIADPGRHQGCIYDRQRLTDRLISQRLIGQRL